MTPVVAGQAAQAPIPDNPPAVMLTAVTQPLPTQRLLTQPTTLAPLQQLASIQPLDPLVDRRRGQAGALAEIGERHTSVAGEQP